MNKTTEFEITFHSCMGNAQSCSPGFTMMEFIQFSFWEDTIKTTYQNWLFQLRNHALSEYRNQPLPPGCPSRMRIEMLAGNKLILPLPLLQIIRGWKIPASVIVVLAPFTNTKVHI